MSLDALKRELEALSQTYRTRLAALRTDLTSSSTRQNTPAA